MSELTGDLEVATEYPPERTGAARSKRRLIGVEVDARFDARLSVFRWEAVQAWEASYEPAISTSPSSLPTVEGLHVIDLQPGANLSGARLPAPPVQNGSS